MHSEYEPDNMDMTNNQDSAMFETTFGVDGEIETFTNPGSGFREV